MPQHSDAHLKHCTGKSTPILTPTYPPGYSSNEGATVSKLTKWLEHVKQTVGVSNPRKGKAMQCL
jgi:hypothetical protein